jgi:hypothetical protein
LGRKPPESNKGLRLAETMAGYPTLAEELRRMGDQLAARFGQAAAPIARQKKKKPAGLGGLRPSRGAKFPISIDTLPKRQRREQLRAELGATVATVAEVRQTLKRLAERDGSTGSGA